MRSNQVHRALLQVPNRYALCQTISRSARLLHKTGNPIDGSLNTALDVLTRNQSAGEPTPVAVNQDADSLYRRMQYTR
ncbi:MAG TPA: hypothetical protein VIM62_02805 [Acidobacteriaceae bacterium]